MRLSPYPYAIGFFMIICTIFLAYEVLESMWSFVFVFGSEASSYNFMHKYKKPYFLKAGPGIKPTLLLS